LGHLSEASQIVLVIVDQFALNVFVGGFFHRWRP
jgi:hypothetical protein